MKVIQSVEHIVKEHAALLHHVHALFKIAILDVSVMLAMFVKLIMENVFFQKNVQNEKKSTLIFEPFFSKFGQIILIS